MSAGIDIEIRGAQNTRRATVLNGTSTALLSELQSELGPRRQELLDRRGQLQSDLARGARPGFRPVSAATGDTGWQVPPAPADLSDRRVEITGPTDAKMMINALNSGARVFMADFEDANTPTWANMADGQANVYDAVRRQLAYKSPEGKDYRLGADLATLVVRPRGWHLAERNVLVNGRPMSASLFDFGVFVANNGYELLERGSGPYFYLAKLENADEAALWRSAFEIAEHRLGLPAGTIRATVLIETILAAFEMEEVLHALGPYATALNAGRWDYMFSFIKKLRANEAYVLPDRSQVVMGKAFLRAYSLLLIRTCHRRGAFAMGGMAAQIPNRKDPVANEAALERVRADKEREAGDGHDGTWVAHPDLVPVAKEVFDRLMPTPNQLGKLRLDVNIGQQALLEVHQGTKTEAGLRENIRVGVQYIEAWLRGRGAVPLYNLMEDAATAEISRAQVWQWIHYGITLEGGTVATPALLNRLIEEEMRRVRGEVGAEAYDKGRFTEAVQLFRDLSLADDFEDFLTVPAMRILRPV